MAQYPYGFDYQQMPYRTNNFQPPVNGVIKVSGETSALQYGNRMPPNSTSPAMFDENGKVFYIVTTDGAGMPTVETFDFYPHVQQPTHSNGEYVSRQEFDEFVAKINAVIGANDGVHGPVQSAATAVGEQAL